MTGALAGLRILDLTTVQMGPWCTRIVADLGAEVIKVEAPEGDSSRYSSNARNRGMSGGFQHNARGKRSIALDLKKPEARDAILRLSAGADAFVSNIRPAALERLGLGYEAVRKTNASIVYLGMVGYGSGGRYAGRPAYDDLIQAASAIPMLLQRSTGEPRFIPMAAIDRIVGTAAANALLAGLLAKARTGVGQKIEVPMFETMVQFVLSEHMQGASKRQVLTRMLNNLRGIYQRLGDGERELAVLEKLGILNPKDERVAEALEQLRKRATSGEGGLN